ncbi:TetR family transcriptional regulator C-terminal domain-containing protein [Chryseolinea sp. T2]|uniref:TetR/AcrR family transcriptional regulator n=1 Tax=Chryseolinea sp. T2 TaxID=3129255 RepID=UPI0030780E1F
MKTAKKTTRKAAGATDATLRTAYIEYLLTHGARPASVYKFCQDLGIAEEAFYSYAGSFDGLEQHIWTGFMDHVIGRLQGDAEFSGFSSRDKILTFYYALLEELKRNRSFVLLHAGNMQRPTLVPSYLKGFKASFERFIDNTLSLGKDRGEVATRPLIDKRYPKLFWLHMGFILTFWKNDNSADFEKTDAAVEKSVNLAFDLLGKGAVDSAIDFGKFLYQTAR